MANNNKNRSSSKSSSKTTTKSKTTKKVNSYVSTKPTVKPAQYKPMSIDVSTLNQGMPDAYQAQAYEAQNYSGPTYDAQQYQNGYQAGTYDSKYMPQIEQRLNDVANWKYDPLQDASYQALAAVYGARGNQAAKNSLADAAALNGGYGTSNAVSAAQQARNQYNQELAAMIPELEQAAYNRAQTGLGALMDVENTQYGRFRDTEEDKKWAEQNAQNIFSMNNDERYKAVQNAMDVYGLNRDDYWKAAGMNQDERYKAYDSLWDRYGALNDNTRYANDFNREENHFKFNAGMDRADLLNNYYQWATGYNNDLYKWKLAQQQAQSSGSGGGGRSGGGGGGYSGGSTSTTTGNGTPTYDDVRTSLIQSSGNNKPNNKLISANNLETVKYKNKKGGGRVIK